MKRESQEKVAEASDTIAVENELDTKNGKIVSNGFSDPSNIIYSVKEGKDFFNPKKVPERYYRVIFSERENDRESQDIFLCCNGEELLIKRGVEIILPEAFYDIARHAVVNSFKMNKLTNKREPMVYRRFSFSVLGETNEQEYRNFVNKCRQESEMAKEKKPNNN